jgi:hypothetical protein
MYADKEWNLVTSRAAFFRNLAPRNFQRNNGKQLVGYLFFFHIVSFQPSWEWEGKKRLLADSCLKGVTTKATSRLLLTPAQLKRNGSWCRNRHRKSKRSYLHCTSVSRQWKSCTKRWWSVRSHTFRAKSRSSFRFDFFLCLYIHLTHHILPLSVSLRKISAQLKNPLVLIDYRCDDDRFPLSASFVTISNPELLSSSEPGDNPGIRSWKKHLSEWARRQKAIGGIYFTKK